MQVKLKNRAAGPSGNWPAGSVIDVSADVAEHLINSDQAEAIAPAAPKPKAAPKRRRRPKAKPAETAEKPAAETTAGRQAAGQADQDRG